MALFLGVDGGASKTHALLCTDRGRVLRQAVGGGSNFQVCGIREAERVLAEVVGAVLAELGEPRKTPAGEPGKAPVERAVFGLSGADRPADFKTFRAILDRVCPAPGYRLVNDTVLALRAATVGGVGVALIGGTGTNAVGIGPDGTTMRVGGMGRLGGDWGSGGDLGEAACMAAARALDGRGPATILERLIRKRLGLAEYSDIVELGYHDASTDFVLGNLAPLVFEAAAAGDEPARGILERAGREQALSALAVLARLFPDESAEVTLALGGSLLQKGAAPTLRETLEREVRARYPNVRIIALDVPPVLGALCLARDDWPGAVLHEEFVERARGSWRAWEDPRPGS